jgi:hypothetical protein
MSEPLPRHAFRRNHKNDPPIKGCVICGQVIEAGVHEPHVFRRNPADAQSDNPKAGCALCGRLQVDGMHVQYPADVKYLNLPQKPDGELVALGIVVDVMEKLTTEERVRILGYLDARYTP